MAELLPNGFLLHHEENRAAPSVACSLLVGAGARDEDARQLGLTSFMAKMLDRGTASRGASAIAEAFEDLGAVYGAAAGLDATGLSVQALREDFPAALALAGELFLGATFPWDEIDRLKPRVIADLKAREDRTPAFAMKRLRAALFLPHAYGRPAEGEEETVRELGQRDLALRHRDHLLTTAGTIAIVGDIGLGEARDLALRHFPLSEGRARRPAIRAEVALAPRASRQVLRRAVQQGFAAMGFVAPGFGDADAAPLAVAANILGGGMSSRLFTDLRDRRGLAYAVGCSTVFQQLHGYFYTYIGTRPQTLEEAEKGLWEHTVRLREEVVGEEDLDRARNYLTGNYLRAMETNRDRAGVAAAHLLYGYPAEFHLSYLEQVKAVTSRDVMRVANRYLLDPCVVVVEPESSSD
ncbi:MAG: pitrilysin family protein [Candidatus Sumerlaeia bacterium]|nr:pitrilysin family protein [Candidatus Sumerlaeia bacterium]